MRIINRVKFNSLAVLYIIIFLPSCFGHLDVPHMISERKKEIFIRTVTKVQYEKIEPTIRNLKSGNFISFTDLKWDQKPISLSYGGAYVDYIYTLDGWIGSLSGNDEGAAFGFGRPWKREKNIVYGSHIFGYLLKDVILVPKYTVITRADIIDESEYKKLESLDTKNIGWYWIPGNYNYKNHIKNIQIYEIKQINAKTSEAKEEEISTKNTDTYKMVDFFNQSNFDKTKEQLNQINAGMDYWDVLNILNGNISRIYGVKFGLFMPGLLNYKGDYMWEKMTSQGYYQVFPLGYMQDSEEIPKINIILKNGKVERIEPYKSKSDILGYDIIFGTWLSKRDASCVVKTTYYSDGTFINIRNQRTRSGTFTVDELKDRYLFESIWKYDDGKPGCIGDYAYEAGFTTTKYIEFHDNSQIIKVYEQLDGDEMIDLLERNQE